MPRSTTSVGTRAGLNCVIHTDMDEHGSTKPEASAATTGEDSRTSLTIGFIGVGVMGRSMAGHLLNAGHRLRLHTRTPSRAESLVTAGAVMVGSPAAAADGADAVISMVGTPADVEAVHLGAGGTLSASRPPRLLIEMTTSQPALAVRLHAEAARRGAAALDAPVSGGDVGAQNATLSIMVGGDLPAFASAIPLLELMGKTIVRQGGPGSGQHTKMVNQILIASTMIGVVEGLLYAAKAGLDPQSVLASVGGGAAGSWSVQNLAPRIVRGDFNPGFFVDHFVKDLSIALDEATRMGLDLPGLALAKQLYEFVQSGGYGRRGTQALYLALAARAGIRVEDAGV